MIFDLYAIGFGLIVGGIAALIALHFHRSEPYDWWQECPELRQRSHVHVVDRRPLSQ